MGRLGTRNWTLLISAINALLWSAALVIGTLLVSYQYQQGSGSLLLVAIGILPYLIGLIASVAGPVLLLRALRNADALVFAFAMLIPTLLVAFWFLVGLGST